MSKQQQKLTSAFEFVDVHGVISFVWIIQAHHIIQILSGRSHCEQRITNNVTAFVHKLMPPDKNTATATTTSQIEWWPAVDSGSGGGSLHNQTSDRIGIKHSHHHKLVQIKQTFVSLIINSFNEDFNAINNINFTRVMQAPLVIMRWYTR